MRFTRTLVFLSLAACSEQVEERYPTFAEAERGGAVSRGWIPSFVPASAREISSSHDLDSNRQTLTFVSASTDAAAMVEKLSPVASARMSAVAALSNEHGFSPDAEAFLVCGEPLAGTLLVDRKTGRAVFTTTVDWPAEDCSRATSEPA